MYYDSSSLYKERIRKKIRVCKKTLLSESLRKETEEPKYTVSSYELETVVETEGLGTRD